MERTHSNMIAMPAELEKLYDVSNYDGVDNSNFDVDSFIDSIRHETDKPSSKNDTNNLAIEELFSSIGKDDVQQSPSLNMKTTGKSSQTFYVSNCLGSLISDGEDLQEFCKSNNIPYNERTTHSGTCVLLPVTLQHFGYSYYLYTLHNARQCSLNHILFHIECIEQHKNVIEYLNDSFLPQTKRFSEKETTLQLFYEKDYESFNNVDWNSVFQKNNHCRKNQKRMRYPTTIHIQGSSEPSAFCLMDIKEMDVLFTKKRRRGHIKGVGGSSGIPRSNFYANQVKLEPSIFESARRQYPINPPQICALSEVDDTTVSEKYKANTITFVLDDVSYERADEQHGQFVMKDHISGKVHYAGVFSTNPTENVITYTTYLSMQAPVIRIVQEELNDFFFM